MDQIKTTFWRQVDALARRVVEEGVPLSEIRLDIAGTELARLMRAVKQRISGVYKQISENCQAQGHEVLIPVFRAHLANLFNMAEWQLDPLVSERGAVTNRGFQSGEVRTSSGQLFTPERADRELLLLGNIYISPNNGNFLQQAKLNIERVFINQCQNVEQQRKIIEIVAGIKVNDLVYIEAIGGLAMFHLHQDICQQLNIVAMLAEEDRQSSRSGEMRAVTAPSGVVEIGKVVLVEQATHSKPKRSLSDQEIQAIKIDWDDIGWEEE